MKGRLAALNLPGIGSQSIRKAELKSGRLVADFSSWQAQIHRIWPSRFSDLALAEAWKQANLQAEAIANLNGEILCLEDQRYPAAFYDLKNPPILLSAMGETALLKERGIALVGTRTPTKQARESAYQAGISCAKAGRIVVSGLALGCDTHAHWGAIHGRGQTVAVLPSSLSDPVPKRNARLAEKIVENGGVLISELFPGMKVEPYHFVQRNRLIAALSDWIVVVEAGLESGTMHTVRWGRTIERRIGAIPSGTDANSEGCLWIAEQEWGCWLNRFDSIL